jgi:hypothetical protein
VLMFNPFAPNRTRGRFAFSWVVVVHTAMWLNSLCATEAATPSTVSLQSPHSPELYTYTQFRIPRLNDTFRDDAFHPPTLGRRWFVCLWLVKMRCKPLSMLFVCSRCCWNLPGPPGFELVNG